jgi:DNA helicase HerA-like ATPase
MSATVSSLDRSHPVPPEALEEHIAVLGKTGAGKTYTAKGLVEALLRAQKRVVVIDPLGAWWGLRSSADGRADGFPVAIFGGVQESARRAPHRRSRRLPRRRARRVHRGRAS